MNEKKQINELCKLISEYHESWKHGNCDWRKGLAEAIYNADYRKQEWISVEERLPNPKEEVLVCDETGDVFTDLIECDGKWDREISRRWGIKYLYWMPLPEAPKMKGGAE